MPAPWSKSAPKSDRRQQWKALKAKHAKTISVRIVEVGLGKALDEHQKQVDAILALDAGALKPQAFAPVVASAKALKTLALGLEPKVAANADYKDFLAELKKDAAWWEKAAQDFKQAPANLGTGKQPQKFNEAMKAIKSMQDNAVKVDALLKDADKKTKTYTPNEHVIKYIQASAKFRTAGAKLAVLNKNPTGNYKAIVQWLGANDETIRAVRLEALYVHNLERWDLPATINRQQLVTDTQAVADAASDYGRIKSDVY